jgi:hypothetical protein
LRISPVLLVKNDAIKVQVQAQNDKGWGLLSDVNTGGSVVHTEPVAPGIPVRASTTDDTKLDVTWTGLTTADDIGGPTATVQSYNL